IRTELRPQNNRIESDPTTLDLVDGVTSAAVDKSIGFTLWTIPVGEREMALYRRLVSSRQVDGFILHALRENDPRIAYLQEQEFPFVVFGRLQPDEGDQWIDLDGAAGVEMAVQHLAELGHERIGYLGPPREQHLTHVRWNGFVKGMNDANLRIDPALIFEGDFSEKSGQRGTHELLDSSNPPTGIICSNDRMAFGAMRAIQARGLVVGKDVSVVGFDDIPLAHYSHPPLTTISQPFHEIGKMLFKLLMSRVSRTAKPIPGGIMFKPILQVRQSTGSPR
ncbi:MAG: substrate-binding domain-containing protein, partial [Anaerolineae bacterium]